MNSADSLRREGWIPDLPALEAAPSHVVQFYEQDGALVERLAEFAGAALGSGNNCLMLLTEAHREALVARLSAFGLNVEQVSEDGRLVLLDAVTTLDLMMVDGWPDGSRFAQFMDGLLPRLAAGVGGRGGPVSIFGELVAELWLKGMPQAAIRLEQMWNDLAAKYHFTLLCAYPMRVFSQPEHERLFGQVCTAHSDVVPCESYAKLANDAERLASVAALQQKAEMLERALSEKDRSAKALSEELGRRDAMEDALRKSEEFSRNIVESSADCIKVLECDGRLVYMSRRGLAALGLETIDPILGRSWMSFWDEVDQPRAAAALAKANAGGIGRFEGALVSQGETRWWDVTISPMLSRDGQVERLTAISREVTELKLAQSALLQAEKLAAAGRLAATVAHEINNPLEAVTNSIYLAKQTQGMPEEAFELLTMADEELTRVGHIAQQTLGFYRDNSNSGWFALGDVIRNVASIYERRLQSKDLTLELQIQEGAQVFARKGDLKQVLSNLLTNAIDATPQGGRIVVRAHGATEWTSGRPGMRILVADTGEGMSGTTQVKAFSAFYTTKVEVGTGIGLWVTRKIIENHSGSIHCRSVQGEHGGTVMNVFLPGK